MPLALLQTLKLVGIILGCWAATAVVLRAAIEITNQLIHNEDPAKNIKTPSFAWSLIVAALLCVPWLASYSPWIPETDPPPRYAHLISFVIMTSVSALLLCMISMMTLRIRFSRGLTVAVLMIAMLWAIVGVSIVGARLIAGWK